MKMYMMKCCLPHVVQIREDEGLVDIKTTGDDVFGVLHGVSITVLLGEILPQIFLIVCQLNDQRNVKHFLKPSETQQDAVNTRVNTSSAVNDDEHTHLVKMKGIRWPTCMASEDGPLPVYR